MIIRLNDGESLTVAKNHDKSEKPLMYTFVMISGNLVLREFGEKGEMDTQILKKDANHNQEVKE